MFIDVAKLYVKAGDGGDGCNSFERDQAGRKIRPNGGPGGNGGDIIFVVDENIHTLLDFQYRQHFEAKRGGHASSNNKKGAFAEDRVIKIPKGTIIKDFETDKILVDLINVGQTFIAAKGGEGGAGNSKFRPSQKGQKGEEKTVFLELKLIADVGIVGYPNAGKSTLISRLSAARPKIANYPFTTKEPTLGVARFKNMEFVIADIPGLIEGAHSGKGLGDKFLRHIERTRILIHMIDMAGVDQRDPLEDYRKLNNELALYSEELAKRPQVIVANKMDIKVGTTENLKRFKNVFKRKKIIPIAALNGKGLDVLLLEVIRTLRHCEPLTRSVKGEAIPLRGGSALLKKRLLRQPPSAASSQ